jgi:hypothetical protein
MEPVRHKYDRLVEFRLNLRKLLLDTARRMHRPLGGNSDYAFDAENPALIEFVSSGYNQWHGARQSDAFASADLAKSIGKVVYDSLYHVLPLFCQKKVYSFYCQKSMA